ncbi:DUF6506 family protein [Microlunatus parietis]|uniref:Uncharacterized protein n=1 Tax=Microlunatus parietis TaxID=682979 RepID=A0A7Y9I5L4_9ACTN|nr:DUF6506 family protein [Microlunatus parietis]NYE70446.1 hypothetical protein [Microlunatus parietis]
MSDYDEAFLFLAPEATEVQRKVLRHSGGVTALIWVPDGAAAAEVAAELAAAGTRLFELYRGFDLAAAAGVIEAVDGRAPVGVPLGAPQVRHSVTIFGDEGADPAKDRLVHHHADGGTTTVVGAPNGEVVAVAQQAVEAGAELIQVCGGEPLTTAAKVAAAVGDRVPVTLTSWPFESITGAAAFKAAYEEAHPA